MRIFYLRRRLHYTSHINDSNVNYILFSSLMFDLVNMIMNNSDWKGK